jgi:outer membrane protein OmpA-like peptidoglycan-associated protein
LSLDNVNFETNEAVILPESYEALDEVGEVLEKWSDLQIEIGGHTDNQGEEDYNLDLSQRRAQAVLDYLTGKFDIDPTQYVAKGYGESQPVTSNGTAEGRAENRRVEFTVLNRELLEREEPRPN